MERKTIKLRVLLSSNDEIIPFEIRIQEYVTEHSKRYTWSWVGIVQDEAFHSPKWVNSGGVDTMTV